MKQFPMMWNNLQFDSKEEVYLYWWLKELEIEGIIKNIDKAATIVLEAPLYSCGHELLPGIEYTPDFSFEIIKESEIFQNIKNIKISPKARKKKSLIYQIDELTGRSTCSVEVKANFDNRDKTREVNIKRKWVYSKFGIYVELVKIPKIFSQTFFPKRYLKTDMGLKDRKIDYEYTLLESR